MSANVARFQFTSLILIAPALSGVECTNVGIDSVKYSTKALCFQRRQLARISDFSSIMIGHNWRKSYSVLSLSPPPSHLIFGCPRARLPFIPEEKQIKHRRVRAAI